MREQFDLLWSYVRGAWRFRWYALGVAWLVAGLGWAMSLQVPDEYESSARVHVDTESMLRPLMRGMVIDSNVERRVELMTRTLLSRPNLEQIAREADLDLHIRSEQEFDRVVDNLQRRLNLSGAGRDNLYRIRYRSDDPQQAHNVVRIAVNLMIEESMGRTRQDSESATRFLDRKIEEYEARVDAAEQRRIEFRREHSAELQGGGYYERLERRRDELRQARFELELVRSRELELENQLAGETPVFGIMDEGFGASASVETPELDRRIERTEDELDELLLKYTDEHPRVGTLQRRLERLREERDAERERLAAEQQSQPGSSDPSVEQNPVHQEIRAALARARADLASAQSRVDQLEADVSELEQRVDTIPEIEARFQQLTRAYEAAKSTYDELVNRRQTAEISGEVERSEDQVEFRVVDPPRVPNEPVSPNRPLLITASLGAAGAGGGALGLLLTLMWPAFHSRTSLQQAVQLPVLGAIEHVHTTRSRRRFWLEMGLYVVGVGGLLVAYGVIMYLALAFF